MNGVVVASAQPAATLPQRGRPQMADVARLAGVSVASVSRALNGGSGVAPRTRARIEGVARALHYEVDERARLLRLGRNCTVAIVLCQGAGCASPLGDAGLMGLVGAIADALVDQGFEVVLSRAPAARCEAVLHDYERGRAAALVLVGDLPAPAALREMAARGVPCVAPGRAGQGQAIVRELLALLGPPVDTGAKPRLA